MNHLNLSFVKFGQKFSRFLSWPLLRLFAGIKVDWRASANTIGAPLIVVANHQSFLDPPLVGAILANKICPIFFMTKDKLMAFPIRGRFLKALGGFPAFKGEGLEKSLEIPKKILEQGGSVVIFPQGKFYQDFEINQGRPGAATLALQTETPVLPVALCGFSHFSWLKFFLFGYKIKVVVGQPFSVPAELDSGQATELIMGKIKENLTI